MDNNPFGQDTERAEKVYGKVKALVVRYPCAKPCEKGGHGFSREAFH